MQSFGKVLIACPMVARELPQALKRALDETTFPVETTYCLRQELARSLLVSEMMNRDLEYVFFIDSDMVPDRPLDEIVERFYETGLPVVSALTSSKGRNHKLLLFRKNPRITYPMLDEAMYEAGKVIRVYAIGFGACLIHRSVFDRIGMPWFRTSWDYVVPETGEEKIVGGKNMGADFFFSMRCNREGVPLNLDCGLTMYHTDMDGDGPDRGRLFPDERKLAEMAEGRLEGAKI